MTTAFTEGIAYLREHLDDIVEEIVGRVLNTIPSFMRMPPDFAAQLRVLARRACQTLLRQVEEERVTFDRLEVEFRDFELVDMLRAFQVGSEIAWKWIKTAWDEAGYPPEDKLRAAEIVWDSYFRAANTLARDYVRERQEKVKEYNRFLDRVRVTQDRRALLRLVVEGACDVLGYRRAVVFLFEHDLLIPQSARDRMEPFWGERILEERRQYPLTPMSNSPEARAIFGAHIIAERAREGDRIAFLTPEPGALYFLVPLNTTGTPRGLLYLEGDARGGGLGEREMETLASYAETVSMALENTQLYREVMAKRRVMDHLMARVNTAHEEERARIARELHDSVAQSLLKIIYAAGFALDFIKEDPQLAVDEIEEVQQRAKDCLRELREIMANLRPTSLDILGLKETIQRYAEQFEEEYAISTSVDLKGLESIPTAAELPIFRILQEQLTNVRKHSRASTVRIRTEASGGDLILTVEDDGVGFDPEMLEEEQESGEHLGLMAMRERAELLGGQLIINSLPGMGTRITVKIPMITGREG
ncbi:MAG: GAF domain-containing sensor histidine kinase [Actinobacteria bacterium]|nr:GAF domain-containing sensor histidine kinase [Actinomycetota bacterium]